MLTAVFMMAKTMNGMLRISAQVGLVVIVAIGVTACGVKSSPTFPPDRTYPRQYPEPLPTLKVKPKPEKTNPTQAPVFNPGSFYQYPNQLPGKPPTR
jgi:hypothetical protein